MVVTPRRSARLAGFSAAPNMLQRSTQNGWLGEDGGGSGVRGETPRMKLMATFSALSLMLATPPFTLVMWFINEKCQGSSLCFGADPAGLIRTFPKPTWEAFVYVVGFGGTTAALQMLLPGKAFVGPMTPQGHRPVYTANGVQCFVASHVLFFSSWHCNLWDPARVLVIWGNITTTLVLFGFGFCAFLWIKGTIAPSGKDSGSNGSWIYDLYWGLELYPRLGAFDIKLWTNCRFGMTAWALLPLCYAAGQAKISGTVADSMLVCCGLINIYLAKFFWWETGYLATMDIQHDRAGFYLCWGCLVWVPCIYTSPALYLAYHPVKLGLSLATAIFVCGCLAIYINFAADEQRKVFRATKGAAPVWGVPPRYLKVSYKSGGETKQSLLLASGWWGLARHFHYLPEITAAFCWSVPAMFTDCIPYFYVVFLTLLLVDRAQRDDIRCRAKYGAGWDKYCAMVPYKVIPSIW